MGRRIRNSIVLVGCALVLAAVLCSESAWASTRVALVVGNGSYDPKHAPELLNPVNDARLMARSLETSGFEVQLVTDADQAAMKKAIKAFGKRLVEAGGHTVGLFYYAGHGVEDRGQNYLIPLGAEIESEVDFHTDAVLMDWVLARMRKAGNLLNMVILDACRNNPFDGRYRGASQGLAQMDAPSGSLIAYAAAPRQVAYDGVGENSPYTAALAEALVVPGLKIEDVFKRVRVAVEEATNGEQTPWENSSLRGDFYFVAKAEEPPSPKPSPTPVPDIEPSTPTTLELAARAYEAAERVNTVSGYELVIEQFPGTFYAALAKEQLEKLKSDPVPPTPSAEEVEASRQLKREERRRIQFGLRSMGFKPGSPDGLFGSKSRKAIRAWQRKNGHAATGHLTEDQANTILTATPPTALLQPKCEELPGQYLGENHAECWVEIANRSGCYLWRTHYHSDQTTEWSGRCREGIATGHGIYSVSAGSEHSVYEGTGTLVGGKTNGRWTDKWADGDRYEGEYRDGKRHGRGVYTWPDGGRYEGEYRDGKQHGRGLEAWANGNRYKGEYRNDKMHGRGIFTFSNGNRYEGQYRDNKPHGLGTYVFADGDRYEGQWREGCFLG